MKKCLTLNCENDAGYQSRYCGKCERARYKEKLIRENRFCTIDNCNKPATCRGMCHMHYRRWKYHGDASITKRGKNGDGCIVNNGYRSHYIKGKHKLEHRVVMEQFLNRELTNKEVVHHRNKNKLDNRIENLVITDRATHKLICDMENVFSLSQDKFYELFNLINEQFEFTVQFIPK